MKLSALPSPLNNWFKPLFLLLRLPHLPRGLEIPRPLLATTAGRTEILLESKMDSIRFFSMDMTFFAPFVGVQEALFRAEIGFVLARLWPWPQCVRPPSFLEAEREREEAPFLSSLPILHYFFICLTRPERERKRERDPFCWKQWGSDRAEARLSSRTNEPIVTPNKANLKSCPWLPFSPQCHTVPFPPLPLLLQFPPPLNLITE